MELKESKAKPEESRSMPFDIDLNETPISSPRETPVATRDDIAPATATATASTSTANAAGEGIGTVKGKGVLLDINALPSEAEGEESCELVNSGMHAVHDTSIGNSNNGPVTCSNLLFVGSQFDLMKASGNVKSIVKLGPVDIVQQRQSFGRISKEVDSHPIFMGRHWASDYSAHTVQLQNLSDKLLQALKEFVFDNHGILEDGWHVEFFHCQNRCKAFAVYCSPDGNKFESMFDVALHLGLVSNCHSLVPQDRSDGFALVQNRLHLHKRREESLIFSRTKDFKECQENLKSSVTGELSLGMETMDAEACKLRSNLRVARANSDETGGYGSSHYKDGFPVRYEDFFILSVGEVDPRPSYHNTSQIWPVGYKSIWHDKITGSLFVCDVSDGGDCGPVFKVQRYPCSTQPIPIGATVLSRSSISTNNNKTDSTFDVDDHEDIDIQMIFSDNSPPQLAFNTFSGIVNALDEASNFQPMCELQTDSTRISQNLGKSTTNNGILGDDIGKFLVEGSSSSSVWKMVSQNLVHACHEAYKQTGVCKFSCRHDQYGWWSSCLELENVEAIKSTDSLAKFCHISGPVNVPHHIQSADELTITCEALVKWLDQDRFGLDADFVQEIIEQLPGAHACSDYKFLNKRSDNSKFQTVGSGFLLAKRKNDAQGEKEPDSVFRGYKKPKKQVVENCLLKDFCPPGKQLSSNLPTGLIGDVLQSWELLWRFAEVLGLDEVLSFNELEEELIDCYSFTLRSSGSMVNGKSQHALITEGTESLREGAKVRHTSATYNMCTGETLTKAHCSLLKVLLIELQTKLAAFVDPTPESGESRSRKRRKKEADSLIFAKKTMLDLLPINGLTWLELARRYVLTVLAIGGNLDSVEIVNRESCKVFHCLQGHSGALCSSLPGVAGMEADALLLAEATKQIFGSSKNINDHLNMDLNDSNVPNCCKNVMVNDGEIPEWAQVLEPVRKLPTNVGARIRKRVYEALDKNPPDWAKKVLEHSISKEVYKGNASGPTKKAVLSLLADVYGENHQPKPVRKKKNKCVSTSSDVIMKHCRKVLRCAAAADEEKVFCNLLGRTLLNISDNDDEGLLGFPTMVSRPLDFRTIDLRLAYGAYGGSHEAFLEDVREVWHHIRTAYADQSDLVHLAETLSQNFEELYEKEVLTLVHKLMDYDNVQCLSSEAKKEMEDILEHANEIPKAPWDEGVCKVCGVDKDDDNVLLCDKCDSGYHTYCLNPPLARIPEGNWYCPSCVTGHCVSQGASQVSRFISRSQKKKHQGDFTHGFLEALTNLGTTMEVKDYWEYSIEERVFLLKFLGDEVLNSANIREHLEQCASVSSDLQQKLRSLSTEWRNLKFREEILTEKLAKVNASVVNGVGKSGAGGMPTVISSYDKLMGQPLNSGSLCLSPSNDLVHLEKGLQGHRTNDITKQPFWLYSKGVSDLEQHSTSSGSQFMKTPGAEFQVTQQFLPAKDNGHIFEKSYSHMLPACVKDEFSWQNKLLSNPQQQKHDSNGDHVAWRSVNKEAEFKKGSRLIMPICEVLQGHVSSGAIETHMAEHAHAMHVNTENLFSGHHSFVQPDVDELQACNLEASIVKNKISVLQDSITCLESQLQNVSLRKELLGRDSAGQLYWVFSRPGSSPWVVVDRSVTVQQKSMVKENRDLLSNNLTFDASPIGTDNISKFKGSDVSSLYVSEQADGIPISLRWLSYQSDAEIQELIRWLRENDPMARELLESLLQRLKLGYKKPNKTGNIVPCTSQSTSKPIHNEETVKSNSLATRAFITMEKKYGPCLQLDVTNILTKQSQNAEVTSKEKMGRCECLELLWPSRHHCHLCHSSFSTTYELKEHKDGKCSSDTRASQNTKVTDDVSKGKAMMRTEPGECSEKMRLGNSGSVGDEIGFGLVGFSKDLASPYGIEEISTKFVIRSSNKELVREIGLLGSNGIPSFVPCASPYISDPTLKLACSWENEVNQRDRTTNGENQLQRLVQGNVITSKRHIGDSKESTKSCNANGIYEEAQMTKRSNLINEKRDRSLKFGCLNLGNAKSSVICDSSLRPLVGRGAQILRQLKINLLDMEAALPEEALKPSKACSKKQCAWRAFVKSSKSVCQMVQATIVFENMIKTEYLRNEWWYWSSLSAAAKIATVSSLALRIYTLDTAIVYEKSFPFSTKKIAEVASKLDNNCLHHMDPTTISRPSSKPVPRTRSSDPTNNGKPQSKSSKKRKDTGG